MNRSIVCRFSLFAIFLLAFTACKKDKTYLFCTVHLQKSSGFWLWVAHGSSPMSSFDNRSNTTTPWKIVAKDKENREIAAVYIASVRKPRSLSHKDNGNNNEKRFDSVSSKQYNPDEPMEYGSTSFEYTEEIYKIEAYEAEALRDTVLISDVLKK